MRLAPKINVFFCRNTCSKSKQDMVMDGLKIAHKVNLQSLLVVYARIKVDPRIIWFEKIFVLNCPKLKIYLKVLV